MNKHRVAQRTGSSLLGLAAIVAFAIALSGAAAVPSPISPSGETATHACWTEYESGQHACASTSEELAKLVLDKFNKVTVESVQEFERVQQSQSYKTMAVPVSVQASYAIGTLWTGAGYTGSADSYTTSNSATCYGQTYTFSQPSVAWNDATSSFVGQGACQVRLYDDINYGGGFCGYFDCRSNLANVGYNDRASSVRFHLTSTYSCF